MLPPSSFILMVRQSIIQRLAAAHAELSLSQRRICERNTLTSRHEQRTQRLVKAMVVSFIDSELFGIRRFKNHSYTRLSSRAVDRR